jgi:hypothetical protein
MLKEKKHFHKKQMHVDEPAVTEPTTRGFSDNCPAPAEKLEYGPSGIEERRVDRPMMDQPATRGTGEPTREHFYQIWRPKHQEGEYYSESTTRGVKPIREHWWQFWRPKHPKTEATLEGRAVSTERRTSVGAEGTVRAPAYSESEVTASTKVDREPVTRGVLEPGISAQSCPVGAPARGSAEFKREAGEGYTGDMHAYGPVNRNYPHQPMLKSGPARSSDATRGIDNIQSQNLKHPKSKPAPSSDKTLDSSGM